MKKDSIKQLTLMNTRTSLFNVVTALRELHQYMTLNKLIISDNEGIVLSSIEEDLYKVKIRLQKIEHYVKQL